MESNIFLKLPQSILRFCPRDGGRVPFYTILSRNNIFLVNFIFKKVKERFMYFEGCIKNETLRTVNWRCQPKNILFRK